MEEKLDLKIGENYRVELYPKEIVITGRYIGEGKIPVEVPCYLFHTNDEEIRVMKHWATIKDNGVITHKDISSFGVSIRKLNLEGKTQ